MGYVKGVWVCEILVQKGRKVNIGLIILKFSCLWHRDLVFIVLHGLLSNLSFLPRHKSEWIGHRDLAQSGWSRDQCFFSVWRQRRTTTEGCGTSIYLLLEQAVYQMLANNGWWNDPLSLTFKACPELGRWLRCTWGQESRHFVEELSRLGLLFTMGDDQRPAKRTKTDHEGPPSLKRSASFDLNGI